MFACEAVTACSDSPIFRAVKASKFLFPYASVTNLCILVLDRYIAVVKPLKYLTFMSRRRVIQMVSVSWAIPFALGIGSALSSVGFKSFASTMFTCVLLLLEFLPSLYILIFCFVSMLQVVFKHNRADRVLAKQLRFNHQVFFKTGKVCHFNDGDCNKFVSCVLWDFSTLFLNLCFRCSIIM